MKTDETKQEEIIEEYPDNWWYKVYLGVIITTIIVIFALGMFTRYFSG